MCYKPNLLLKICQRGGTVEFRDSGNIQRAIFTIERAKKRVLDERRLDITEKRKIAQLYQTLLDSYISTESISAQHILLDDSLEIKAFNQHKDVDIQDYFNVETGTSVDNQV